MQLTKSATCYFALEYNLKFHRFLLRIIKIKVNVFQIDFKEKNLHFKCKLVNFDSVLIHQ